MPLKKIKKHAKHAPRSKRTACTHTQHWHHGNTNNSNINNFSSLTAPSSMATTSKPMYYGYPNDQIWQYIVMKYIHGLMNGQVDLNKQKPEVIKKDKSVENIATKSPKEKKTACKADNNTSNFLKYINVSTETSSSSTTDLSSPDLPTKVQLPFQQNKMNSEREKSSSDSSNKNLTKNKSRAQSLTALGIKMSAELHKVGDVKAKHDSGDAGSDDDSDDDESSDENAADANTEPSWQTVLQMMQQFGMMSSLCAGGSRGPLPF